MAVIYFPAQFCPHHYSLGEMLAKENTFYNVTLQIEKLIKDIFIQ
jgi:hypothetical protein